MSFLQDYPASLVALFCLALLDIIIMIFLFIFLYKIRGFRVFSIRLFSYMIIGQFILTFVTFAIPFLTNPGGDAYSITLFDSVSCMIQGTCITIGWMSSSMIAVYMIYSALLALRGAPETGSLRQEKIVVGVSFVIPVVWACLFDIKDQYAVYGWHDHGQQIYQYCEISNTGGHDNYYIDSSLELVFFLIVIYMIGKIKHREYKLRGLGVVVSHPMMRIYSFALVHYSLTMINGLVKLLDMTGLYEGKDINWLWQILNICLIFEPMMLTYLFFYFFLPYLKQRMSHQLYSNLCAITYMDLAYCANDNLDETNNVDIDMKEQVNPEGVKECSLNGNQQSLLVE